MPATRPSTSAVPPSAMRWRRPAARGPFTARSTGSSTPGRSPTPFAPAIRSLRHRATEPRDPVDRSGPAGVRRGSFDGQDLAGWLALAHARGPAPLCDDHEQRPSLLATQHAGKAATIEIDRLENLAAFTDAD